MYKITEKQKETYQGIIILNEMINNHREFIINENLIVEPILLALKNKKLIKISGDQYIPTADGRINLQNFYNKFFEFEKVFYIFSAVDFEHGEFAFSKYWDLSEEEFDKYISEPRWYDCRIAVAEYKKMDVIEIVFMSFIKDDKFNLTDDKWEFSLANFETWNEIEECCNNAIHQSDLLEDDIITNVIKEGSEIVVTLIKKENELNAELNKAYIPEPEIVTESYYVEETIEESYSDDYYDSYLYDPYFVSTLFLIAII